MGVRAHSACWITHRLPIFPNIAILPPRHHIRENPRTLHLFHLAPPCETISVLANSGWVAAVEQDRIDITRATPVRRKGAPLWAQLLGALIVVVVAGLLAGLFSSLANGWLANAGLPLPLVTITAATPGAAPAGQAQQGQGQQGQRQGQATAQGQGTPAGQPGQSGQAGQGGNRPGGAGGFGGPRAAVVVTAPATTATINNRLEAIGEGTSIQSVTITPASGGTLTTVVVKPGQVVAAGDVIATLDSGTQQNAYDRAVLGARDADAALDRAQSLAKVSSLSDVQLAAAQLAADQAHLAVNDAKLALSLRTITTPVAGSVGIIQANPGNLVSTQTVITTVEDTREVLVNFWVPERYSSQITLGQSLAAQSAALPGDSFTGTVTAIDNRVDPASRTLQVQATLPNPDGRIKSGMSFSVVLTFPGKTFPAVDPLAIQWSNQGAYVWRVVDSKAQKAMVQIVQRNTDGILVDGDIKPGDAIVTQGILQLTDGATVRLLGQPAPGGNGQGGQGAQAGAQGAAGQNPQNGQAAPQPPAGQSGQPSQYRHKGQGASSAPASAG